MLRRVEVDPVVLEYERIMSYAAGDGNDEALACMLASWQAGQSAMPYCLGLAPSDFAALIDFHFPGLRVGSLVQSQRRSDTDRTDEFQDVLKLLQYNQANSSPGENAIAMIVSRACQGQDHLWQDMGLWSRDQLTGLMLRNFPSLAQRNTKNMKWKKFLYKQLCDAEGIYVCWAPSCEVCADYNACFSPEE